MRLLVLGGSGFLSGTLARRAVEAGHQVWTLTRGRRPLPQGVTPLVADRGDDAAFAEAIRGAGVRWDLAADCVGYNPHDAEQALGVVAPLAGHLVFISTDFVYDPLSREVGQREDARVYNRDGYGGLKRQAELVYHGSTSRAWTILRPCHIYGPGSELGCLPEHSRDPRLLERIEAGETLRLVGGGRLLQQPLFAPDLADLILDLAGRSSAAGLTLNVRGPDTVESRRYYEIVGEILGAPVTIAGIPAEDFARENPDKASFLSPRVYSIERLVSTGAAVPATGLADGLRRHVTALLARRRQGPGAPADPPLPAPEP